MKKVLNYFVITMVLMCGLMLNVKAEVLQTDIDFYEDVAKFSPSTGEFIVGDGYTTTYQYIKIADAGTLLTTAYSAYTDALTAYNNDTTETRTVTRGILDATITTLYEALENANAMPNESETTWKEVLNYEEQAAGDKFVVWVRTIMTGENNLTTTKYGMGIYVVEGNPSSNTNESTTTNPETGINSLYVVPLLIVAGSVLVFKKRRYE